MITANDLKLMILEAIQERFHTSFETNYGRGDMYVEVFKNPTPKELKECKPHYEVGALLTDTDIYVWNREKSYHYNVMTQLKLPEALSLMLVPDNTNINRMDIMVTDATKNSKWHHNPQTAEFIRKHPFFKGKQIDSISYWDEDIVGDWEELKPEKQLTEEISNGHEKIAIEAIRYVWKFMPKNDRFNENDFSLWMDNDEETQNFILNLAKKLYPNDDEANYTFFEKDIRPTLEKLENIKIKKMEKKVNNDPLFILKHSIKNKTWEGAKQAISKTSLGAWAYKGGRVSDDDAESVFNRLYRIAQGETMYGSKTTETNPALSDLSIDHNDYTETLFITNTVGRNAQKFPDKVKVYRGTNSPMAKIRTGDFVTFEKDYARTYSRGKFGTVQQAELPSKHLKVYNMEPGHSQMIYWPEGHDIKPVENVPTFKEFWEKWR